MKTWIEKINGSEFKVMRLQETPPLSCVLDNHHAIAAYLRAGLAKSVIFRPDVENFIVVHLNTRRNPIGFEVVTQGTLDTLLVHPREVFKSAIISNSAAIVLAHNHPSGDPTPSEADIKVTRDLIRAGQLMRIEVLDHVILGNEHGASGGKTYSSLRELGYFYL